LFCYNKIKFKLFGLSFINNLNGKKPTDKAVPEGQWQTLVGEKDGAVKHAACTTGIKHGTGASHVIIIIINIY
jgi:hypothetical protein